jgi:hypothetical protein
MRQTLVLLYAVRGRSVFFGGIIRLDRCFDCRRRGSCDLDRFADGGEQLLSQLLDALSCSSLDGVRPPERIAHLLLSNSNSGFGILPRLTLQFGPLFCGLGTLLGLLGAMT